MEYKYFDYTATTKVDDDVLDVYNKFCKDFYNPSNLYLVSTQIKANIEKARANILKYLRGSEKSTFIFTSCATESNNSVLRSVIKRKDKHYLVSAGEHSSIYNLAKKMIGEGYNIEFVPLNIDGTVNQDELYKMVDNKTDFVSLIHVSNETGAINDIKNITKHLKSINPNIIVHSDGVQALHKIDINLDDLGVDFYTISGHKINCVRGIAGLYIKNPNRFNPLIVGGGQENSLRGGTENYAGIMALEFAMFKDKLSEEKLNHLKQVLLDNITVPYKLISTTSCVSNIISIAFAGVRGETLMHMLEDDGILVGTGSACNSKNTVNRVLQEMGIDASYLDKNIRISFDDKKEDDDMIFLANCINKNVNQYLLRTRK